MTLNNLGEAGFLTANGSRDSHAITLADGNPNGSRKAGTPYQTITWDGIRRLMDRPAAVEKADAPFVILSTYNEHDGRTHDVQRERGVYGGLAVDIDKGDPSIEEVIDAVKTVVGDSCLEVYSSSSAAADNRKWRVLVPLAVPLAGSEYQETQDAFFSLLGKHGLQCDTTLARTGQPIYLPNVPKGRREGDGRPLFYECRHVDGPALKLGPKSAIVDAIEHTREQLARLQAEAAEAAAAKKAAWTFDVDDDFKPIAHFNANHAIGDLLVLHGFVRKEHAARNHYRHDRLGDSGSYSMEDMGDHWVCMSHWAKDCKLGSTSRDGFQFGDAFDLFCYFEHGNDRKVAVRTYAEKVRPPAAVKVTTAAKTNVIKVAAAEAGSQPCDETAVVALREDSGEKEAPPGGLDWQPFPVNLLPASVREYVAQTADGMATDPAMVAIPLLAALAAAIGNTRTIMLKSDWEEPAILWGAIVAESGSLKTPAMRKALQFVVEQEQEIEQRNANAMEQYEQDRVIHQSHLETWKQKQKSRRNGEDSEPPPAPPRKPARTSHVLSDCTIEAVAAILADNPRGVMLERDELSGWLGGFDRYTGNAGKVSSEVGHWLSMHNASPLRLDRKSTGRVYVPRASLSIAGGIQPDTLTLAIGREHVSNGLLARFLLVAPPRRTKRFNTNTAGFMAVDSTRRLFHTLHAIPMPDDGPVALPLTGDGEAAFQEFYERHAERQANAEGVIASMLAKIEAAAARLALIHYICRQAGDEPTLPNSVDAESVKAGVALAEWFAREWQRVYEATIGGGATLNKDGELVAWIESQGGEASVREIGQRVRRYRDAATLEQTITRLVKSGDLQTFSVQNERGGPPAAWVRLPASVRTIDDAQNRRGTQPLKLCGKKQLCSVPL
jgi:hypothetical protein